MRFLQVTLSTTDPLTSASGVDEVLGDGRQPVEVGHGEHVVGVGVVGDGLQFPCVHVGPHAHRDQSDVIQPGRKVTHWLSGRFQKQLSFKCRCVQLDKGDYPENLQIVFLF